MKSINQLLKKDKKRLDFNKNISLMNHKSFSYES